MNDTITLPRSVVEQALEAIYGLLTFNTTPEEYAEGRQAKESLRAALEQQQVEQEPVAWGESDGEGGIEWSTDSCFSDDPDWLENPIPLYTHPQPPRQPLTEMDIVNLRQLVPGTLDVQFVKFARVIEAAHHITGEQE